MGQSGYLLGWECWEPFEQTFSIEFFSCLWGGFCTWKGEKIKTQNGQFKSDCPNSEGRCETRDKILFTEIGRQESTLTSLLSADSNGCFFFFCSSWVNGSHFSCLCFNQRLYVSELIKECHSLTRRTLPFCAIITTQKERLICLYIIG